MAGGVDFACCPPHLLVHGDGAPECVCRCPCSAKNARDFEALRCTTRDNSMQQVRADRAQSPEHGLENY